MRRGTRLAIAGAVGVLVGLPVLAGAAPQADTLYAAVSSVRFCAANQSAIAHLSPIVMTDRAITVSGAVVTDRTAFQLANSSVDIETLEIRTVEYVGYLDAARTRPESIRCTFRTSESLSKGAWPKDVPAVDPDTVTGSARAIGAEDEAYGFGSELGTGLSTNPGDDAACSTVNQATVDAVWAGLTPEQQSVAPYRPASAGGESLTVDDDTKAATRDDWNSDAPALTLTDGVLHVPSSSFEQVSSEEQPRGSGSRSCTFVAPQYLRDVLLGQATVN